MAKITPEQKAVYDKAMEALIELHRLMQPITQDEKEMVWDELRDCGIEGDDLMMAVYVYDERALDEEDDNE